MTDEPKGPILRPIHPRLIDSKTGECVPFTGKCLDCGSPTEEFHYHCRACEDKYIEKNKPTPEQLREMDERQLRSAQRAILWMYNGGQLRSYQHSCFQVHTEFSVSLYTISDLEGRGWIRGTKYRGVMQLTEAGEEEARKLYAAGKSWRF